MAGYSIMVGRARPEKLFKSQVNKQGQPVGTPIAELYAKVGKHLLINRARVWGKRIFSGMLEKDEPVAVTDTRYKGEIKFLDWGSPGGYAVDIRYLSQSTSLDYEYQTNIQKIVVDAQTGAAHIELDAGENRYDFKKDALFISFLMVHPGNRDSKSKNPDPSIKGNTYYEVTDDTLGKLAVQATEKRIDAGFFVKELSTHTQKIKNLFDLLGKRPEFGDVDELSQDGQKYETILRFSETNPDDLLDAVTAYKRKVEDWFSKAKSYKALDLTKNGFIVFFSDNNKKEILWDKAEGKGDDMIGWVIENILTEGVYEQTKTLKGLVDKLK